MNKKDNDPAYLQTRPMKEEDVGAIVAIGSMYFGGRRPEYYREKLGSATKGAGIYASLVAGARTTILQAECKR